MVALWFSEDVCSVEAAPWSLDLPVFFPEVLGGPYYSDDYAGFQEKLFCWPALLESLGSKECHLHSRILCATSLSTCLSKGIIMTLSSCRLLLTDKSKHLVVQHSHITTAQETPTAWLNQSLWIESESQLVTQNGALASKEMELNDVSIDDIRAEVLRAHLHVLVSMKVFPWKERTWSLTLRKLL